MIQAAYACKDTEAQTDAGERSGSMAYIEFQHVKKFYGKKNEGSDQGSG